VRSAVRDEQSVKGVSRETPGSVLNMSKHKKSARELPFWAAIVFCNNEDVGQIVGSFMSFYAQNRYKALQYVRENLPDNPKFVNTEGGLRPIQIIDLRQIRPSESDEWAHRFYDFFENLFQKSSEEDVGNLN
jgi:hypothetical protein